MGKKSKKATAEIEINCAFSKLVPIDDLKPNPRNPNQHPERQITVLAYLIAEDGFRHAIVVSNQSGFIVSGHGRFLAAEKIGMPTVPVDFQDYDSPEQEIAIMLSDNIIAELSEFDDPMAGELLMELENANYDLALTALEEDEISRILDEITIGTSREKEDVIPELPVKPRSKAGDLWLLGKHRILCGDATNTEDVEQLMNGKKANMTFTDPPYNVDYGVSKNPRHKIRKIHGDKQTGLGWNSFNQRLARIIREICKGDIYLWGASGPDGMKQRLYFVEMGLHWSATIIWKKQQLILSPAKYQRIYEPCLYGWFNKSSFIGGRKEIEVWEIDRPHDSKLHPTMKPVALCEIGIANSSRRLGIVWDGFLGSGSTLIACEILDRICYGMEIEPGYIDVTVKRWENYTGKKAILGKRKRKKRS